MSSDITEGYCRKCMKTLPIKNFYQAVDAGEIDSSGYMSVCKPCMHLLYDSIFEETQSIEKSIHKMCITLNIKYVESAVEATKTHLNTMLKNGTALSPTFGVYKAKLVSMRKSMDKSKVEKMTYEDVGTVFVSAVQDFANAEVPLELKKKWGDNYDFKQIEFLENEYSNFKQTHKGDTYTETVLLKRVCYNLLEDKMNRDGTASKDSKSKSGSIKELRELLDTLAMSPKLALAAANAGHDLDCFGEWIKDIERYEPAEWLETDNREMFRDVTDTDKYFKEYMVRPLNNLISMSKDFNIDDNKLENEDNDPFSEITDGETVE